MISIEPQIFKLTAIFDQLDYPIRTHRMGDAGWADRLLVDTRRMLAERDTLIAAAEAGLDRQIAAIEAGYAPLTELMRGSAAAPWKGWPGEHAATPRNAAKNHTARQPVVGPA